MNPKKLDKILNYFREEMSVGNAAGTQGGFSSSACLLYKSPSPRDS